MSGKISTLSKKRNKFAPFFATTNEYSGRTASLGSRDTKLTSCQGGEREIRTPGRISPTPHFECGAFNRSAISPKSPSAIQE